jgi:hypothetical protein
MISSFKKFQKLNYNILTNMGTNGGEKATTL